MMSASESLDLDLIAGRQFDKSKKMKRTTTTNFQSVDLRRAMPQVKTTKQNGQTSCDMSRGVSMSKNRIQESCGSGYTAASQLST